MLDCMIHTLRALDPPGDTTMRNTIKLEPGCLDHVPVSSLATFLAGHGLELVAKADGLRIRKAAQAVDYPTSLSVVDLPTDADYEHKQ